MAANLNFPAARGFPPGHREDLRQMADGLERRLNGDTEKKAPRPAELLSSSSGACPLHRRIRKTALGDPRGREVAAKINAPQLLVTNAERRLYSLL